MATTTNYGWETPDDTDLVKDGAAAIRTLGNSVDTTTKNLNPETTLGDLAYRSATANVNTRLALGTANQVLRVNSGGTAPEWATSADVTPLTTKGDLFTFTTVDARLGIGANNTVLTADSAEATGMKWATPAAAGGMTLIASTSPTGVSTTTFSSISGDYKHLLVVIQDLSSSAGNINLNCRLNGATTNYFRSRVLVSGSSLYGDSSSTVQTQMYLGSVEGSNSNRWARFKSAFWIYDYANTATDKTIIGNSFGNDTANTQSGVFFGVYDSTSAVTSLTIFDVGSNNFSNGTIKLYGVS